LIYIPAWKCGSNTSFAITIGKGGELASKGTDTIVRDQNKTLTAKGGGNGSWGEDVNNTQGGSGGAGWTTQVPGKTSIQPRDTSDGIDSYTGTGWGNQGGTGGPGNSSSGGGGGAGGNGSDWRHRATSTFDEKGNDVFGDDTQTIGGRGKYYGDIFGTTYGDQGFFASGGTGNGFWSEPNMVKATKAHLGGGGKGDNTKPFQRKINADAMANTGGGGGSAGFGGSGTVIIIF
jgi:hypothetical protein